MEENCLLKILIKGFPVPVKENLQRATAVGVATLFALWLLVGCSKSAEHEPKGFNPGQDSRSQMKTGSSGTNSPQGHQTARNFATDSTQTTQARLLPGTSTNSPVTISPDSQETVGSVSLGGVPSQLVIEKISGYKTAGEYFILPSKKFSQAMSVVTLPQDYENRPDKKYPLVIVFGGAGECAKPPRSGALAWMHYYKTDEAVQSLQNNHLEARDFKGLVKPEHLDEFNRRLKNSPYDGVILVCPYSPLLSPLVRLETPEYESYIVEELIPALKNRYRVASGSVGVDGVSMGGARSMYYGFKYPNVFSSIGSVQGAFGPYLEIYSDLVRTNRDILKTKAIQLVTSDGDSMAPSVDKMHRLLDSHGISHRYLTLSGPHDYIFNQGPGSLALLVFHNQALSQKPTGPIKRK